MSRRKGSRKGFESDLVIVDEAIDKKLPPWLDELIADTAVFASDVAVLRRASKIAAMCDVTEKHLYSVQYNQCCCGWRPTDTPPGREFLEHVLADVVDTLKL